MRTTLNDRRVEVEINHGPSHCDSFAEHAVYLDTDCPLSDGELDELQVKCADEIYQDWHEAMISKADFYDFHQD